MKTQTWLNCHYKFISVMNVIIFFVSSDEFIYLICGWKPIIFKHYFSFLSFYHFFCSPVDSGRRIYQLHLCWKSKTPPPNQYPGYDNKPFYGEAPVLYLWRIWSTPSLQLIPGSLWPWVVVPVRIPQGVK